MFAHATLRIGNVDTQKGSSGGSTGLLNDSMNGPVFVHCERGADRTGTVIAAYRISQDPWENKRALREAKSCCMERFRTAMHYVTDHKPAATTAAAVSSVADTSVVSR